VEESELQPKTQGLEAYLEYAAALRPIFPISTENKNAARAIPPELYYAVLTVFNLSMLEAYKGSGEVMPSVRFSISPARFLAKKASSRRGIATDEKFLDTLKTLEKLGYLTSIRKSKRQLVYHVTEELEKALRDHATISWSYMTENPPDKLCAVPFSDLLQLNEDVFNKFFYGDFGERWRAIRSRINDRLTGSARAASVNKKRDYHQDHIHEDVNLWAVFNLVVVAGEVSFLNISAAAKNLRLQGYVTDENDLQGAAKRLIAIDYLKEHPNRMLRFHKDVENEIGLFRKEIAASLNRVRDVCSAFRIVTPGT
jgi:hypothetical protein